MQLFSPLVKPKTPFFSNPKLHVVVVATEVGVGIGVSTWVLQYDIVYLVAAA